MPNISMCHNKKCTQRQDCYRYRAVPDEPWQWYLKYSEVDGVCAGFRVIEKGDRVAPIGVVEGGRV